MITYIHRSKLEPHPDNPRKDLGDLSELTASIQKQGLLQNLTVVPSPDTPDKYRIVIGHRRFNASAVAGLDELPCIIDEKMTYPEQIAVMMSENIQRNDLTITEKVGGVQMMMDLGMDVNEISGNTGISDTTVRRYAKIGKLNKVGLAQAEQRGATLMQFAEISEIEDEVLRQEALEKAGTGEYNHVMFKVRNARDRKARLPLMVEKLANFAQVLEKEDYSRYMWADCFRFYDADVLKKIDGFKPKKGATYVYLIRDSDIVVYEERPKADDAKEQAKREAQERLKARINHEREIAAGFKNLRDEYMDKLKLKDFEHAAQAFVLWVLTRTDYQYAPMIGGRFDKAYLARREHQPESYTDSIKISLEEIGQFPAKGLLLGAVLAAYDRVAHGDASLLDRYSGKPKENAEIIRGLYYHLECLGYPISREEQAWLDGTHECFTYPHDEPEASN